METIALFKTYLREVSIRFTGVILRIHFHGSLCFSIIYLSDVTNLGYSELELTSNLKNKNKTHLDDAISSFQTVRVLHLYGYDKFNFHVQPKLC